MYRQALIGLVLFGLGSAPLVAQHPASRGGGPPFCRSGAGHPVHGIGWCVAKGWVPAHHYYRPALVHGWDVHHWDDARFRHRRPARGDRWIDRREMVEVVGEVVVRRMEHHDRRWDGGARIQARWMDGEFEGVALEVWVDSRPVALLHDVSRDGRIDRVYMRPR